MSSLSTTTAGVALRVALYARYSSDLQNAASIEDQFLVCREHAARENWNIVATYHDAAISGSSLILRPGLRALLEDARQGKFNVVLGEALDRLSRDQADIATLFKRLRFADVKLVTLSEGDITELHIGLKGTMNALFLKDHASKIRRGVRGRVLVGKAGGSISYGYEVVKHIDADGEPIRGDRRINPDEAEIVRRVFREYGFGVSPWEIAQRLNNEKIPGPTGGLWIDATIRGKTRLGVGLINNELYIGKLVWNRTTYQKNPDTGRRAQRLNPPEMWIRVEVPALRIIDDELWQAVKARQAELTEIHARQIAGIHAYHANVLNVLHRPRALLSGLLKCGHCGGSYTKRGQDYFRCGNHTTSGDCANSRSIRRQELEDRVLIGLRGPLMDEKVVAEAARAFTDEIDRLNRERHSSHNAAERLLAQVEKKLIEIIAAIEDGGYSRALSDRLHELEGRKAALEEERVPVPIIEIRPPSEEFRRKVEHLAEALKHPEERDEAVALVRGLIDRITITSDGQKGGHYDLTFHGDLATIIERMAETATAAGNVTLGGGGYLPPPRQTFALVVAI